MRTQNRYMKEKSFNAEFAEIGRGVRRGRNDKRKNSTQRRKGAKAQSSLLSVFICVICGLSLFSVLSPCSLCLRGES